MLREINRGAGGDRRWFQDHELDLFVWNDEAGEPRRFELTYDKPHREKSLTWERPAYFTHCELDDGSDSHAHPGTPVHTADAACDTAYLLTVFRHSSRNIDADIVGLVTRGIMDFERQRQPAPNAPERASRSGFVYVVVIMLAMVALVLWWIGK